MTTIDTVLVLIWGLCSATLAVGVVVSVIVWVSDRFRR